MTSSVQWSGETDDMFAGFVSGSQREEPCTRRALATGDALQEQLHVADLE
jgi:hypothetical protein